MNDWKMDKQELIDSLQASANQLAKSMIDLNARIDLLKSKGQDASVTIEEIFKAADEIGRINDAISDLLSGL